MHITRLVIARPSGNVTAIVFDEVAVDDMRQMGATIQEEYPSVEQVLFVQKKHDAIHGQMAGGEFCGNAARALGYVLADQQKGAQVFTMSGLSTPVTVTSRPGFAKLTLRTGIKTEQLELGKAPIQIVHLEGISHAVLFSDHPLFPFLQECAARPDRWNTVKHVLDDLQLSSQPASGLVFVERNASSVAITPYVFVRDIETLYAETSCASGSIAVASLLGKSSLIRQPSGEALDVTLHSGVGKVRAEVDGTMGIIWDGPFSTDQIVPASRKPGTFRSGRGAKLLPAISAG